MVLTILGLVYFIILICAGGLWHQALQPCVFALSIISLFQIGMSCRKKRLVPPRLYWPLLALLLLLPLFLIPLSYLPSWLVSPERQFIADNLSTFAEQAQVNGHTGSLANQQKLGLNKWGTLRFFTIILLFANTFYLVSTLNRRQKKHIFFLLIAGAAVLTLSLIISKAFYKLQGFPIFYQEMDHSVIPKITAGFRLNNHFGVYLCFFLPFCLNFAWHNWKCEKKPLAFMWLSAYIWIFIGICLAGSRGAYLLAFIVSASVFIRGMKKVQIVGLALASFVLVMVFMVFLPKKLKKEFQGGINETTRIQLYKKAPEVVADYPMGIGAYAYRFISTHKIVQERKMERKAHHTESTPLQFLQEWGVVPFIIWLILLFGLLVLVINNYQKGKLSRRLAKPSCIAMLALVIHSQYDFPFESPVYAFTVAAILGFLMTKGQTYDLSIHNNSKLYLSYSTIIFPLVSVLFSLGLLIRTEGEMYKDHYRYGAEKDAQNLVELLHDQPSSWHTWLWLGKVAWNDGRLDMAEKAFKNAALYFPNHAKLWDYLAKVRYLQGKEEEAAKAFRIYYLQLSYLEREEQKEQAKAFFKTSDEEVEKLFYINLKLSDFKRENLLNI